MSRKDPYFSFKDKDSAEYKPQYGTAYTPRQEKILSGELPLEDIRPNELSLLKQKAKKPRRYGGLRDSDPALRGDAASTGCLLQALHRRGSGGNPSEADAAGV